MHRLWSSHHVSTINLPNSLVPQANAQSGNVGSKGFDDRAGEARLMRGAWTRGYDDGIGLHRLNLFQRHLIVTTYCDGGPQFRQVLIQVVGETIVIVNQ